MTDAETVRVCPHCDAAALRRRVDDAATPWACRECGRDVTEPRERARRHPIPDAASRGLAVDLPGVADD